MTDDLVTRLRTFAVNDRITCVDLDEDDPHICSQAADAIERKDAALRVALEALKPFAYPKESVAYIAIAKIKEALND